MTNNFNDTDMRVHGIDKAVVKKTGKVVNLSRFRIKDESTNEISYETIEDGTKYSAKELDRLAGYEGSLWVFIPKYLPDYYSNDNVALSDDIECAFAGEADNDKLQHLKDSIGSDAFDWLWEQIRIDTALFEEAARNYWEKTYKTTL